MRLIDLDYALDDMNRNGQYASDYTDRWLEDLPKIVVEMEDDTMKLPNYKLCTLHLHPIKDADIIQWLDCQRLADSKTNAIRKLIRAQIRQEIREKLEGEEDK